jgi:shikimate dehydrogenase
MLYVYSLYKIEKPVFFLRCGYFISVYTHFFYDMILLMFMNNNSIVLIGFASCGKSATAYAMSRMLHCKFVDLDKEIELRYYFDNSRELHYRDIILQEGAEEFYKIENRVLNELKDIQDCIIAPGGGAPLTEENRRVISELGTVIYLKTYPDVVFTRMAAKGIPLFLKDDQSLENVKRIWDERDKIYSSMTDLVIDNTNLSILETARKAVELSGKEYSNVQ